MSQLARERNRSAVAWSFAAIAAWIGAELAVIFCYALIYEIGIAQWGWTEQEPVGLRLFVYILALVAAIMGASAVRRVLRSLPVNETLPPLPPRF